MLKVYGVRDVKSDSFDEVLIVCPTDGIAKRSFIEGVGAPQSRLAKYAADFSLYQLGEFDPSSGKMVGAAIPEFIMSAVDALDILEAERRRSESKSEAAV